MEIACHETGCGWIRVSPVPAQAFAGLCNSSKDAEVHSCKPICEVSRQQIHTREFLPARIRQEPDRLHVER